MPSLEGHIKLSLKRTGKDYRRLHEWLDGKDVSHKDRFERHSIINVIKFLPFVKKEFGVGGVKEYLRHLKDDYKINVLHRLLKRVKLF
jgi:hypothetical protein